MKKSRIVHGLGVHQLVIQVRSHSYCRTLTIYLIDTAHSESKGTTFDTSAVHIVPNKKNKLP